MLGHLEALGIALKRFTLIKISEGPSVLQYFIKSFTGLQRWKELKLCIYQGYALMVYTDLEL